MTARVTATTGPAGSGKTSRALARYRAALSQRTPQSTLWLSPTWRATAAVRDRLMDGTLDACLSPAVMTFDQFAEAVLLAAPEAVRPLSRLMKRLLVRLLLNEQLEAGRIRHFLPIARTGGFVDQVCEIISELKRLDIWPDRFRRACRSRGMTEKDAELLALYEAYQQVLNEHHLYDAEGCFWSARRLLREGQRRPFEHLRLVVVDGFADFTPPQHEILQILAGRVEELWITLPLEAKPRRTDLFNKPLRTLAELRRRHPGLIEEEATRPAKTDWPAMAHLEAHLFTDPRLARPASETTGLEILAASRRLGEIERIGSRIKRLITTGSQGTNGHPVPPGDVAVVFRSIAEVDPLVREIFDNLGIPVALESGPALERSTALAALVGLLRLDVEDWPFRGLLAVLSNNYFQPEWPEWQDGLAVVAAERAIRGLQIPRGRKRLLGELQRQAEQNASSPVAVSRSQPTWGTILSCQGTLETCPTTTRAPCAHHKPQDSDAEQRARQAQLALPLLVRLRQSLDRLPERATLGRWADAWRRLADETGLLRTLEEDGPRGRTENNSGTVPIFPQGKWDCPLPKPETCLSAAQKRAVPDRDAWKTFDDALRTSDKLSGLLGRKPPEMEPAEALASLLDILQSVAVRDRAEESGRVRILSAPSVRALRIPYLFFAGLAERSFPPPDRQDRLYGEAEYRALIDQGLPLVTRSDRNREEMLLFYEVMTRAWRQVSFSYPALDEAAQPLSASPYLDEVELACGPGKIPRTEAPTLSPIPRHDEPATAAEFRVKAVSTALEGNVSLLAGFVHREPRPGVAESILAGLAMIEARRDRNVFGPTEGILGGDDARREMSTRFGSAWTFSATELEQYASCPYRFFLDRVLGLAPLEDLDLSLDYRARGRLVHRGLADFHQRVNEHGPGPTSPAALEEEDYRRLLGETFQRLSQHAARGPLDAALHEVDLRLWTRWADDYRRQHEAYDQLWQDSSVPLRPAWFEVSFGRSGDHSCRLSTDRPLELSVPGGVIRIAGRIDRIDTGTVAGQTVFNVIDYKTGTSTGYSRDALTAGTALQLPLYAMATQELLLADEHALPWQAGYWAVQQNGFKPKQALRMYECRDERLQERSEWESVRANVVANVARWVEAIRAARFPVSSADADCTRNCPFRTVCRINHVRSLGKTWEPTPHED